MTGSKMSFRWCPNVRCPGGKTKPAQYLADPAGAFGTPVDPIHCEVCGARLVNQNPSIATEKGA